MLEDHSFLSLQPMLWRCSTEPGADNLSNSFRPFAHSMIDSSWVPIETRLSWCIVSNLDRSKQCDLDLIASSTACRPVDCADSSQNSALQTSQNCQNGVEFVDSIKCYYQYFADNYFHHFLSTQSR